MHDAAGNIHIVSSPTCDSRIQCRDIELSFTGPVLGDVGQPHRVHLFGGGEVVPGATLVVFEREQAIVHRRTGPWSASSFLGEH